jgi:hypothetical protein
MFLPALPLLLLGLAAIIQPPGRLTAASGALVAVGLGGYALSAALNYIVAARPSGHIQVASRLGHPGEDGQPLSGWIDAHVGPQEPVLAADGQATGHLLRRPTVSLVGAEYSDVLWNEQTIEQTMERFGIRFLILYAGSGKDEGSPFLTSLVAGQADPHLRLAAHNDQSFIFERPRPSP